MKRTDPIVERLVDSPEGALLRQGDPASDLTFDPRGLRSTAAHAGALRLRAPLRWALVGVAVVGPVMAMTVLWNRSRTQPVPVAPLPAAVERKGLEAAPVPSVVEEHRSMASPRLRPVRPTRQEERMGSLDSARDERNVRDEPNTLDERDERLRKQTAPESELSIEAGMVGAALNRLRTQTDPKGALVTLDAYDARFPQGVLRQEAGIARVEALLTLERRTEALATMDTLSAAAAPPELRLVHAELLAQAGRCREAVGRFDAFVLNETRDAAFERALFGRATCRAQLRDSAGARADLQRYLELFPKGLFAEGARNALSDGL